MGYRVLLCLDRRTRRFRTRSCLSIFLLLSGFLAFGAFGCSRGQPFDGWFLESYGDVTWHRVGRSVELRSANGPGGLTFRLALHPHQTYRLTLDGRQVAGHTLVRLKRDRDEPDYFPAPDGQAAFNVSGDRSVELMVYSDTPHAYEITRLSAEPCPSCLTDEGLKALIVAHIPRLTSDLERDRLAAAHELLDWAANVVDFGDTKVDTTPQMSGLSAAQSYQDFWMSDRMGATSCAGFASFFAKVLKLFGYDAFTVDMGYPGTPLTHVTTMLIDRTGVTPDFYIFDPTFNGVYRDRRSGAYVSLARLLAPSPTSPGYRFQAGAIKRDVIWAVDDADTLSPLLSAAGRDLSSCTRVESGPSQRFLCARVPYDRHFVVTAWKKWLEQLQIPATEDVMLHLLKHRVLSVSLTRDDAAREQFVALLKKYQIPYGQPTS